MIRKRLLNYLEPLLFLAFAAYGLFLALFDMIILRKSPGDLLKPYVLMERVFGKTWLTVDSRLAAAEEETVVPILVSKAFGTVLEIGPGSGNQLSRYDLSKVTKIYGVEPNLGLHEALRMRIKKAKLDDIYTIVPCGAEETERFESFGITPRSIDTILSIQVLCCVPDPQATLRHLYAYLKPGGKLVVYEHIKSVDYVTKVVQNIYNIVWPYPMGNCHINRPTEQYLRAIGGWTKIHLQSPPGEEPWTIFPRVCGELTK